MNREMLLNIAGKPLRALRRGRSSLSSMIARFSPRNRMIASSYRLEKEGRFEEALAAWETLKGTQESRAAAFKYNFRAAKLTFKAGRLAEAVKAFGVLRALDPNDERVAHGLETAALRLARSEQSEGRWLEAARMWAAFGQVTEKTQKAVRNLADCARYVAQSADTPEKMGDALEAWGLLKTLDPDSREARQGSEWCRLSLARAAEKALDWSAARRHWNAMLEISPGDPRALDGLRRVNAAGT